MDDCRAIKLAWWNVPEWSADTCTLRWVCKVTVWRKQAWGTPSSRTLERSPTEDTLHTLHQYILYCIYSGTPTSRGWFVIKSYFPGWINLNFLHYWNFPYWGGVPVCPIPRPSSFRWWRWQLSVKTPAAWEKSWCISLCHSSSFSQGLRLQQSASQPASQSACRPASQPACQPASQPASQPAKRTCG